MKKFIFIFAVAICLAAGSAIVLKSIKTDKSSLIETNVDALAKPQKLEQGVWDVYYPKKGSPDHNCARGGELDC